MYNVKHKRVDQHGNVLAIVTGPFKTRDNAERMLSSIAHQHEYRGGEIVVAKTAAKKRAVKK